MIYTTFSQLYDELMEPTMYEQWLAFVQKELDKNKGPLLDLACGAGRLAVMLAQAGFDVSGLDFSTEMLALADMHAHEAGVEIPLIEGNMLDLSALDQYDQVTCFADSFCYLKDEAQVGQAFKEVYQHLNVGGKFIFDVITPYQTDVVYPGYMYNYNDESRAFLWASYADKAPHSVVHDLTFFNWNENLGGYDRLAEDHHERTYDLEVYQKLLSQAGFQKVTVTADFGQAEINAETTRWFFACQK